MAVTSKRKDTEPSLIPKNAYVVQANKIIQGKQDKLTASQAIIIRRAIAQITIEDNELPLCCFNVEDLISEFRLDRENLSRDLKKLCSDLLEKKLYIANGKAKNGQTKWKMFQWVIGCEYDGKNLYIQLHPNLKEYLVGLKKVFTEYHYENILFLDTNNSIRIYELLKSYENMDKSAYWILVNGEPQHIEKNELAFTIEQLRGYLGYEDKYKNTKDFLKNAVNPSLDEINHKIFDKPIVRFSYRLVRSGRSIKYIFFKYLTLKEYNAKLIEDNAKQKQKEAEQQEKAKQKALKSIQKAFPSLDSDTEQAEQTKQTGRKRKEKPFGWGYGY